VTVLIVTAVGLLFGAGALLLFRYQCQLRIDRQHELEKVYAVRSALNYIQTNSDVIPDEGRAFSYRTCSERGLRLIVKPVEATFPSIPDSDFFMEKGHFGLRDGQYCSLRDYEYGMSTNGVVVPAVTSQQIRNYQQNPGTEYGLAFPDQMATNTVVSGVTNSVKWWVNIGMSNRGGWVEEDYGRRYFFQLKSFLNGKSIADVIRLCIIRDVSNSLAMAKANYQGATHGWPLSMEGERAIVFQINPVADENAEMMLFEYAFTNGCLQPPRLLYSRGKCPSAGFMGLQIADDKISLFCIQKQGTISDLSYGYDFYDTVEMTKATYDYFKYTQTIPIGSANQYPGITTNEYGKLKSPDLRAVFEVVASSDYRPYETKDSTLKSTRIDFLTNFKVMPAYQYDVFIEHPALVTNRATVAQRIGAFRRGTPNYTVLTYDTHGTEHKGFRQDEREWERKRGK